MQRVGVVVLIVALACVCFLCQASEDLSGQQRRNIVALLRVASRVPKQYPDNFDASYAQSKPISQNRKLKYPKNFLKYLIPNYSYAGKELSEENFSRIPEERKIEGKPPETALAVREDNVDLPFTPIVPVPLSLPATSLGRRKKSDTDVTDVSPILVKDRRSNARPYDVPQIECPPATDQMERFPCPSPDRQGRYRCIDDHLLCDGFIDCPDAEDEDREHCMFFKTTKAHLDIIADAIIRFIRSPK